MDERKLLTPAQVAEHLQVKTATVQGWLREGRLKGVKLGRYWRVLPGDLRQFIVQNMTPEQHAQAVTAVWEAPNTDDHLTEQIGPGKEHESWLDAVKKSGGNNE